MLTNGQTEARKLRARLNHPIIDADGHWAEFAPHMREEFRRIGGDTAVQALDMASARIPNSLRMSVSERRRRRSATDILSEFGIRALAMSSASTAVSPPMR